jgi:hypothetical protein
MSKVTACVVAFLLFGGVFFVRCTTDLGGGTSTSENGFVAGIVVTEEGKPASETEVVILPADFNPIKNTDSIAIDTTDSSGAYAFSDIDPGEYTVHSKHITSGTRAYADNVIVLSDSDSVAVEDQTLRSPGAIKVAVPEEVRDGSGYAYIPGTTNSVLLAQGSGYVIIDSVPVGKVDRIVFDVSDSLHSSVVQYTVDVEVQREDTSTLLTTGWKYYKELQLNTTASGADVHDTLYHFPVLVRLNNQNFNFRQTRVSGNDLLFTKKDDTSLPYEIERWDGSKGVAEIWVKIDTLPGNAITKITMYWGNYHAVEQVGSEAVFDTGAGFAAVWHLDEAGDSVYDASGNRLNGVRHGALSRSESIIGYGQVFDTVEAYCDMGNVLNPGDKNFTVSAWIKRSLSGIETIIAKSDGGEANSEYGWNITFGKSHEFHGYVASAGTTWTEKGAFDFQSSLDEPAIKDTTEWHYIVAVIDKADNERCRLYLDGVNITDSRRGEISATGYLENSAVLRIGAEADGDYQWSGSIDECVISFRSRSEDWIRLCFINQGLEDRLVEF